ncbi:hypothetical protein [Paenibacillus sp. FSL L8-0708]|uniref:hypothetical protein n=1 Tax=Paenibacillus sp. FSL L8-0708 TaxID=2975311 RepID=UPI0030F9752E
MWSPEERVRREREYRQHYKTLILEATRIAVRAGLLSEAYEDFVIDYLDSIVDPLSNDDFDYLVKNERLPVRAISTPEAHTAVLEKLRVAQQLQKEPSLTDMDRSNLKGYTEALEALLRKSEANRGTFHDSNLATSQYSESTTSWNMPKGATSHLSEIDQLQQRIFKAADILDAMAPDDARLPEYTRLYQALWDKYNELQKRGG